MIGIKCYRILGNGFLPKLCWPSSFLCLSISRSSNHTFISVLAISNVEIPSLPSIIIVVFICWRSFHLFLAMMGAIQNTHIIKACCSSYFLKNNIMHGSRWARHNGKIMILNREVFMLSWSQCRSIFDWVARHWVETRHDYFPSTMPHAFGTSRGAPYLPKLHACTR